MRATPPATHTAGVLLVGLALTSFSALAGDTVLGWLGVVSGALVALVGAGLLADARRGQRGTRRLEAAHEHHEHDHEHDEHHEHHEHHHDGHHKHPGRHEPEHLHEHRPGGAPASDPARRPVLVGAAVGVTAVPAPDEQQHAHDQHPHPHDRHHHVHGQAHPHDGTQPHHHHDKAHRHGLFGHRHSHGPAAPEAQPFTTRGLVGLGVAGGLVPSPSALVVLLGAVALGRTVFGAALVVAYGVGMAATLTAVGLLLVRVGDRIGRLSARPAFVLLRRLTPYTALLTAVLVLVVGLGLMIRSLPPLL
ncbi:hypothetical protein ACFV4M_38135 [Kitasatospora indigofera]|uniref:hypothetical protein n=1 Tax=Kitasatospora indigofera TaxID=67307 RepID=UPI00365C3AE0